VRECEVEGWLTVEVKETTRETYRQERRGGRREHAYRSKSGSIRDHASRGVGALDEEAGATVVFRCEQRPDDDRRELCCPTNISRRLKRRFEQLKDGFRGGACCT